MLVEQVVPQYRHAASPRQGDGAENQDREVPWHPDRRENPLAEHQHQVETNLAPGTIWEFVREMDHWARFLTGYKSHEKQSDTESVWTLKGDVGILSRVVRLKAHITEWVEQDRVAFTLTGLNEKVDGGGLRCQRTERGRVRLVRDGERAGVR